MDLFFFSSLHLNYVLLPTEMHISLLYQRSPCYELWRALDLKANDGFRVHWGINLAQVCNLLSCHCSLREENSCSVARRALRKAEKCHIHGPEASEAPFALESKARQSPDINNFHLSYEYCSIIVFIDYTL